MIESRRRPSRCSRCARMTPSRRNPTFSATRWEPTLSGSVYSSRRPSALAECPLGEDSEGTARDAAPPGRCGDPVADQPVLHARVDADPDRADELAAGRIDDHQLPVARLVSVPRPIDELAGALDRVRLREERKPPQNLRVLARCADRLGVVVLRCAQHDHAVGQLHSTILERTKGRFRGPSEVIRRRPTLPGACAPSTIGAVGLNFSVRNGKRCTPDAMTAEIVESPPATWRTLKTP